VLSRLCGVTRPLPASKPVLKRIAERLAPLVHAGDFAQAMMDLGSEICTPKSPECHKCPWQGDCEAFKTGHADEFPKRLPKARRPTKRAATFVLLSPDDDQVYIQRRPSKGLLASMHETPTSAFQKQFPSTPLDLAPLETDYLQATTLVTHTFTHFDLELQVFVSRLSTKQMKALNGEWARLDQLDAYALPTLFRKVIRLALGTKLEKPSRVRKARARSK
jgi:A/G-specific adenine glycosylase